MPLLKEGGMVGSREDGAGKGGGGGVEQKFGKFKYYLSFDGCIVQSHFPVCPRELDHHKR